LVNSRNIYSSKKLAGPKIWTPSLDLFWLNLERWLVSSTQSAVCKIHTFQDREITYTQLEFSGCLFFQCLCENQNIVQIHKHDLFSYEIIKDVIYHSLEYNRTISYTEEHYQELKKSMISMKSSLPLISELNVNIFKATVNI